MKTHDWIAIYLLIMLTIFGSLSYFLTPKDAEGAKVIVQAVIDALGMVLSFKFGVHVATPAPGTVSLVSTSEPPLTPASVKATPETPVDPTTKGTWGK